jgi:hypothetical protein
VSMPAAGRAGSVKVAVSRTALLWNAISPTGAAKIVLQHNPFDNGLRLTILKHPQWDINSGHSAVTELLC